MLTMEQAVKERVARGIKYLDEQKEYKNWYKLIDLNIFDIKDCDKCIVSQIFGDFDFSFSVVEYGFDINNQDYEKKIKDYDEEEYAVLLQEAWKTTIERLQKQLP